MKLPSCPFPSSRRVVEEIVLRYNKNMKGVKIMDNIVKKIFIDADDNIKKIVFSLDTIAINTELSKLNYADTLAHLKKCSLKTAKLSSELANQASKKQCD